MMGELNHMVLMNVLVLGQARLAQIDLFSEGGGGMREASVLRYKEKRRTRLFSKKIRYQVRKVNADRRPRMKVCSHFLSWVPSHSLSPIFYYYHFYKENEFNYRIN